MEGSGSTVPRRQLGRHLKDLRQRCGMTVKAAANALEFSEAKLWRIETGQTALRSLDVKAMCELYGASEELTLALTALAKETKGRGWWHSYGDVIPAWFDLYIGLEESASELRCYGDALIPGLLQTADYARVLIESTTRPEEVDRRVEVRIARQKLLTRPVGAPQVKVALSEAVLRRAIGGPKVMARQLEHLAEVVDLPNVDLRVIPFAAGFHHGLISGPFVMLEYPRNGDGRVSEPTTVYKEGYTGALYLDKPGEIRLYDSAFASMWRIALDEESSVTLIRQVSKELQ